jgi:hypothetical protein
MKLSGMEQRGASPAGKEPLKRRQGVPGNAFFAGIVFVPGSAERCRVRRLPSNSMLKRPNPDPMMKRCTLLLLTALFCAGSLANAQESREILTQTVTFNNASPNNLLVVEGAVGGIEVEGYDGDTVRIEAERIIRAQTHEDLETGKGQIAFQVFKVGRNEVFFDVFHAPKNPDAIYVYLLSPGSLGDEKTGEFRYGDYSGSEYDYTLNYRIKVPFNTNLQLRTVAGDISIRGTGGAVKARLMSGAIRLSEVAGPTEAYALGGDITVSYRQNPSRASSYVTDGGNITVTCKAGLAADVTCEASGQLRTDFIASRQSAKSKANGATDKTAVSYQPGVNDSFRIGKGGVPMRFQASNGSVSILKAN